MFEDPQNARQLVEARLDGARRYVANRRLAGRTRNSRGRRDGRGTQLRTIRPTWFHRGSGGTPVPKPTTA
jgi:hypothetical protein